MIYSIASRLNAQEYLVMSTQRPLGPIGFDTLDQAQKYFEPFYKILSTERPISKQYQRTLMTLLRIHPVIVSFKNNDTALPEMHKWKDCIMTYTSEIPIILHPHVITAMKKGFIDAYQELDIVRDIESITRIDVDGQIEIMQFNVSHLWKGDNTSIDILTEEKAEKILRKRGLL